MRGIVAAVEPYAFDRIYGTWPGSIVREDAKAAVRRSAERYIAHIKADLSTSGMFIDRIPRLRENAPP